MRLFIYYNEYISTAHKLTKELTYKEHLEFSNGLAMTETKQNSELFSRLKMSHE